MTDILRKRRTHGRGLTLVEAVVAGVLVVLVLIAVVVIMTGGARRAREREARRNALRDQTQLRGMHQSMVIYANSNNLWMPGLDAKGNIIADGPTTLYSGAGSSPAGRFAILLGGQYFTGDLLISRDEEREKTKWTTGRVTAEHYSYALLALAGNASDAGRMAEWRDNANSQAVLLSDRHVGAAAGGQIMSLDSPTPGEWRGVVVWGDNHSQWLASPRRLTTRYGGVTNTLDNLFADGDNNPAGASEPQSTPGYNALMVYE